MSILAQEEQGGSAMRRIGQEVQKAAHGRYVCFFKQVHRLEDNKLYSLFIILWFVSQRS